MMEHNCIGRCASTIKYFAQVLFCSGMLMHAGTAGAAPVDYYTEDLAAALATAEGAWADSLLQVQSQSAERETSPYDEQIFTELSPILDSPDAIKLPQDQLLSD